MSSEVQSPSRKRGLEIIVEPNRLLAHPPVAHHHGIAAPLVKLIKQHAAHPLEGGIRLQPSQKQPIGDDLHLSAGGPSLLAADGESDALSQRFLQA